MSKGILLVLSGPSGTGKSTVISRLMELRNDIVFSVSATTRPMRPGEVDGVNYYFVDRMSFVEKIQKDEFLEYVEYAGNLYGTPEGPINESLKAGKNVILDIEVQGAGKVMSKRADCVSVFMCPPTLGALRCRLEKRGTESQDVIEERLAIAKDEYKLAKNYNYIVINDDVDKAANELNAILTTYQCLSENRISLIIEGDKVL